MSKPEYISARIGNQSPISNINLMVTPSNFKMDEHEHPFYHMNRVLSGDITIKILDKVYQLDAGCIFVIPPNTPHSLESKNGYAQIGTDVECINDPKGLVHETEALCHTFSFKKIPISMHEAADMEQRMRYLLKNPSTGNIMRAYNIAECQILDLLDSLRNENADSFSESFAKMVSEYEPWILKLSDMCRILNVSRTQLERRARLTFGCGAIEYCNRLRYGRVCELLESGMTLDAVAAKTGFCDSSHLSKFFALRTGMSPGEYRSAIR